MIPGTHPVLTCDEARELEAALFAGDTSREWHAMQQAGEAIAAAVLRDFEEIGGFPANGRILVVAGKGHNGGDALIAARQILERFPAAAAAVRFAFGVRALRPLAARAWRELVHTAGERATTLAARSPANTGSSAEAFALCLDGIFGFQFRPPCDPRTAQLIADMNATPIGLRAAVDLPSAGLFQADFTYATGSVKTPALDLATSGRVRYLNLGFLTGTLPGLTRVLTPAVLAPLAALRLPQSDKRSFGHVFVLGGSRSFPGAVLMALQAALHSGAGLVTAFVPESLASAFAARVPEAIWVGWPETPDGGLALEGLHLLRERIERATALVIGPGIGREPETLALVTEAIRLSAKPVLLDADALQPEIVRGAEAPLVLTPHAGEFARLAGDATLEQFAATSGATIVLKGPVTRIACRKKTVSPVANAEQNVSRKRPVADVTVYLSFFGGPVLARGGSGDLLAGMIGAQLAQLPDDPELAAARGLVWHGLAADLLAQARGQVAVTTTQLLDYLPAALREAVGR